MSFEDFWKAYPRKTQKAIARESYDKIVFMGKVTDTLGVTVLARATPEELLEAALAFRWKVRIEDETPERFIPLASTWLNQSRFEDQDEDERKEMANKMRTLLERMEKPRLSVVG
ncbi:MAG TPA: hypothetical protein DGZ24_01240 [Rhodospirillaceae bacterium]|nr:hypothetical protein [Rhodospirillaceae bacterium]|tara:strand:+ start:847 stop:1191 length:345 start_codon:yes stop_codon:yes gene_type:complete